MTLREFLKALNSCLPPEVVILKVEEADSNFHSQKSAVCKLYRYSILNRDFPSALDCRFAHYIATPLDVDAMRTAAQVVVGCHDFTSFRGRGCTAKTAIRAIHECQIVTEGDYIRIDIQGDGFLRNMVRIIAGTLIQIGKGKMDVGEMQRILDAKNRNLAGPTAPSRGLCLEWVSYEPRNYQD